MEYRSDVCTDEDRDFIVDDGYKYEDPTHVPDEEESFEEKYVVTGKDFDKLTKKLKNSVLNLLIIQSEKITNM